MFFFRPLFSANGFHPETRFSIIGWGHWVTALVTVGWWGALVWASWQAVIFTNLALFQLHQLTQRAAPPEATIESVGALFVIGIIALLVATITAFDITFRFCVEVSLWLASSVWRFRPVRRLAARAVGGFERKVLRRAPEWEVELDYPAPLNHRGVIAPSELAQQIGRERAQVLRER